MITQVAGSSSTLVNFLFSTKYYLVFRFYSVSLVVDYWTQVQVDGIHVVLDREGSLLVNCLCTFGGFSVVGWTVAAGQWLEESWRSGPNFHGFANFRILE